MNILITGATGFIGRNLVEALLKDSHRLYALVRDTSQADFLKKQGVILVYADITREKSLNAVLPYKIDALFHCAAYVEDKNWEKLYQVNVVGTENICRLALRLQAQRLVYLSSVAVISGNPDLPLKEDLAFNATNLYGRSKLEAEKKVLAFREKGLRVAVIRPCMVYGEGEPHLLDLILRLFKLHLLPVINGGSNRLHLVYVKNVVRVLLMALDDDEFLKGAYFAADEDALTVKEIFTILSQTISRKVPPVLPLWLVPVLIRLPFLGRKLRFFLKDRVYDISRIKALGYQDALAARQALVKTAQHWLKKQSQKIS